MLQSCSLRYVASPDSWTARLTHSWSPSVIDFPSLISSQHTDRSLMKESVEEVVRKFRAQLDHVPILSLYDSDKGVDLTKRFGHNLIFTEHDV